MKSYITLITIILCSFLSIAQPNKERMKTLKIAFITEQLDLTEKEAQEFWPIYNAHEKEMEMIQKLSAEKRKNFEPEISETKAKALLEDLVKFENEKQELRSDYIRSLYKVLPAKKILKLLGSEKRFKRRIMEEFRKRHKRPRGN